MKKISIPVTTYQVICPKCAKYTTYSQCESSFYDFQTFYGLKTKSLYRLDLDKAKYGITTQEEFFSKIVDFEGGKDFILAIPQNIECKHCLNIFPPGDPSSPGYEEMQLIYVI